MYLSTSISLKYGNPHLQYNYKILILILNPNYSSLIDENSD